MEEEYDEMPFDLNKRYRKDNSTNLLDKRTLYSNAIKDKVNIICINPKNTFFYGSAILKNLAAVAGDYDIWEKFKKNENIEGVVKDIQKIIKNFVLQKSKFFIEFKSGLFVDAILYIGYLKDNKIVNYDYEFIKEQIKNKPYLKSLKPYIKKNPTIEEWMILYDENRLLYVLRWTPKEILNNKKKLPNGEITTLENCIIQPTITKIETIFDINGRFVGFSNYFDLELNDTNIEDFKQSLQLNTLRMYKDGKWMKVLKRIFAQEKNFFKDNKVIDIIYNFLISDVGRLNRINTDLKCIQEIINTKKIVPMKKTIQIELDNIIDSLATINIIDLDLNKLDEMINDAINDINRKKFYDILEKLIKYITKIIDEEAYKFGKSNSLFPLPKKYMPTNTKNIMNYNLI